uniref:Fucosyltransferase n=1 Tax=Noccaea caerulescens TaxID=107243 RepID=A0A1J3EZP3_NOCCA
MKLMITIVTCLLVWSVMLLSFFNHQLLDAKTNDKSHSSFWSCYSRMLISICLQQVQRNPEKPYRYQSSLYRKPSPYKPSQYLISKLRSYEILLKRCGPGTYAYKKATEKLGHGYDENYANKSVGDCRYIVWVAVYRLGNIILTLASLFLYAL